MSISLLHMPVKFQIEIAKDDKKFDFSLGGLFFSPPCTPCATNIETILNIGLLDY